MGNAFTRLRGGNDQSESNEEESKRSILERIDESELEIDRNKLHIGTVLSKSEHTIVYEGSYMDKPVAIKLIEREKGTNVSPERRERFLNEVKLLAGVQNENIVKCIGYSMEPCMTLVTELMVGGSFQKYLWMVRPFFLDRKEVLVMALEIAKAMKCLHENGIIHRDLKPGNIFLSESKKHVKLGDFGLCREGLEGYFTADVGSSRWKAPEMYSRVQQEIVPTNTRYNHKVDVYSYGILLWEMMTTKTPFPDMDNEAIELAVLNDERPRLDERGIFPDIRCLLENCWSTDPRDRLEFWEICSFLEEMLTGVYPGWDYVYPTIIASRIEQKTLFGEAKKICTRLCSCLPSRRSTHRNRLL